MEKPGVCDTVPMMVHDGYCRTCNRGCPGALNQLSVALWGTDLEVSATCVLSASWNSTVCTQSQLLLPFPSTLSSISGADAYSCSSGQPNANSKAYKVLGGPFEGKKMSSTQLCFFLKILHWRVEGTLRRIWGNTQSSLQWASSPTDLMQSSRGFYGSKHVLFHPLTSVPELAFPAHVWVQQPRSPGSFYTIWPWKIYVYSASGSNVGRGSLLALSNYRMRQGERGMYVINIQSIEEIRWSIEGNEGSRL